MSRFIFPYGIRFRENGKIETFPAVEIFIFGKRKERGIKAIFYLDSGATISILPGGDAEVLDIDIEEGEKILVRGIFGKALPGYRHLVTSQFNGLELRLPVVFLKSKSVPRILGRAGVFNHFGILFDELKQRTLFLEAEKERKTIDSLF